VNRRERDALGGGNIKRQERLIRNACRRLGTYTYFDVREVLRKRAANRRRGKYMRTLPTRRQVIRLLAIAPWSRPVKAGGRHGRTLYEYVEAAHVEESAKARRKG